MKLWGQPAKGRSGASSTINTVKRSTEISGNGSNHAEPLDHCETFLLAGETARRTREFLDTRGWCLWQCSALGGEVIAVIRDGNVLNVPEGYPVYTESELKELCRGDISEATLRLVHEAKKLTGAKVESSTG